MRVEDLRRYIKNTEKMVVPATVASTTMGGACSASCRSDSSATSSTEGRAPTRT